MSPFEKEYKQGSLDRLRTEISSMLEYGDDGYVDFQLMGVSTQEVHNYLDFLSLNNNLPDKLLKVQNVSISDMETYDCLCDYCGVDKVPYDPLLKQEIYFIERSDSAITVIPIQLDRDEVNINIELLENSPKFIKELYKNIDSRKLKFEDIKFVKFNKK